MTDDTEYVPDFSGDDFANDKEIQKIRREAKEYQERIDESLSIIKSELGIGEPAYENFENFSMFGNLNATILDSYGTNNAPFKLLVFVAEYSTSYPVARGRNSGTDCYLFGYMDLIKQFPKTYICKETIREKISNLILRNETDFQDNKKFSRRFNVLTQDAKRLTDLLRFKDLDELTAFPNMEVEIHENACLFRNSRSSISPENAREFSMLAKTLTKILN